MLCIHKPGIVPSITSLIMAGLGSVLGFLRLPHPWPWTPLWQSRAPCRATGPASHTVNEMVGTSTGCAVVPSSRRCPAAPPGRPLMPSVASSGHPRRSPWDGLREGPGRPLDGLHGPGLCIVRMECVPVFPKRRSPPGNRLTGHHEGIGRPVATRESLDRSPSGSRQTGRHEGFGRPVATRESLDQSPPGNRWTGRHQGVAEAVAVRESADRSSPRDCQGGCQQGIAGCPDGPAGATIGYSFGLVRPSRDLPGAVREGRSRACRER
jgi:hypothetical protein